MPRHELSPWHADGHLKSGSKGCQKPQFDISLLAPAQIRAIEKETRESMGQDDLNHLQKMRNITLVIYALGLAT